MSKRKTFGFLTITNNRGSKLRFLWIMKMGGCFFAKGADLGTNETLPSFRRVGNRVVILGDVGISTGLVDRLVVRHTLICVYTGAPNSLRFKLVV